MKLPSGRKLVAPIYLFLCLVLGGSIQNAWFNALLQLGGVGLIAWAAFVGLRQPLSREARHLALLIAGAVALVLLHLLPLSPALWSVLPGRQMVAEGLTLLGLALGWQPLSLAPYATIAAALPLLPPIGMLAAIVVLRAYTRAGLTVALVAGAVLGLALGVLQVGSAGDAQTRFYLQPEVNPGTASGFFANPNHMATLLLICLPFLAALLRSTLDRSARGTKRPGRLLLSIGGLVIVAAGLVLNGSLAGLGLLIPVSLACLLIVRRFPPPARLGVGALAGLGVAAFALLLLTPLNRVILRGEAEQSIATRQEFMKVSAVVARAYAPIGSGIGTFERVYRMNEDPRTIDATLTVNHAHNDYLELLVETGVPGAVLVLLFLLWWARTVTGMVLSPAANAYARAGAVASAAVLVHSLVDYPLRTSAISVGFAMCLGLILVSQTSAQRRSDLRPTRHLTID